VGKRLLWNIGVLKRLLAGKRMRCLELEMTQAEIVVSTRLTNVGTSDPQCTGGTVGGRGGAADSRV